MRAFSKTTILVVGILFLSASLTWSRHVPGHIEKKPPQAPPPTVGPPPQPPPQRLGELSITLSATSVTGGIPVRGTVSLAGIRPLSQPLGVSMPLGVSISSTNPSVATMPSTVTMMAGRSSATFTITTNPVTATTDVTISALVAGQTKTATLRVWPPALATLTLNPSSVTGAPPVTGTVSLTGPALATGVVVSLRSDNKAATVPASVQIPGGTNEGKFTVTVNPVSASTNVSISASYGEAGRTAVLMLTPVAIRDLENPLNVNSYEPSFVTGGENVSLRLRLTGPAPSSGVAVPLSNSIQTVASVPGFVQISGGSSAVDFTVVTIPVAALTGVEISASYAGFTRRHIVHIYPPRPSEIKFSSSSILGGAPVPATLSMRGAVPTGGITISLTSSSPAAAAVPATVTVPVGATSANFTVTTYPVTQPATVNVEARISLPSGYLGTQASLTVLPSALKELGFNPTSVSYQAGTADGWVSLTGPAPTGATVLLLWTSTAATAPFSVPVPAGATTATFKVTLQPVSTPTPFALSAYYGGVTKTATLTVNP